MCEMCEWLRSELTKELGENVAIAPCGLCGGFDYVVDGEDDEGTNL